MWQTDLWQESICAVESVVFGCEILILFLPLDVCNWFRGFVPLLAKRMAPADEAPFDDTVATVAAEATSDASTPTTATTTAAAATVVPAQTPAPTPTPVTVSATPPISQQRMYRLLHDHPFDTPASS
jgi:hypothetical protein